MGAAREAADLTPSGDVTPMAGEEIRRQFLGFYKDRGHRHLPGSSLVPEDPTVLLTIAGMLQFKPIFLGQAQRPCPRATTAQKCVRTNDIENVGVTPRHHTFFEMLGNFSFGDYFKREAIPLAWELVTEVYRLPPERVCISVFRDDRESFEIWRDVVGLPEDRIFLMGEEDNFWASGPTGPCGPCTEMYFDFQPGLGLEGADLEDGTRFVEFYNLVFMQYNRSTPGGELEPLERGSVDTGMGLERMAQILQGKPNNYETDLIFPIVQAAAELAGLDYHASDTTPEQRAALKVIGDHARAVAYLISDGVNPSNVGRGYVVRRLIRRVVMKGRLLGVSGPILRTVVARAVELSRGGCDPDLITNAERVLDEVEREEARFVTTLERGEQVLEQLLAGALGDCDDSGKAPVLGGADAFMLYDTYGFPLEITKEAAEGRGVGLDEEGFKVALEAARELSRSSATTLDLASGAAAEGALARELPPSDFLGFERLDTDGEALALVSQGGADAGKRVSEASEGAEIDVVLDRTPFYAEKGGQVGDRGELRGLGEGGAVLQVLDCQWAGGGKLAMHRCKVRSGTLREGDVVQARVDAGFREGTQANHTATHLLQSALKGVLGEDTAQQGSLVRFDGLRFDFNNPQGVDPAELREVEVRINRWIQEDHVVETEEMPLAEAKAAGATAMFGEKYGDVVRVVDVPGVSMELCGGTHVRRTGSIGAFKILQESGIASGVRRIEAVVGAEALEYLNGRDTIVRELSQRLNTKPDEVTARVEALLGELKSTRKELEAAKGELAAVQAAEAASEATELASGARFLVAEMAQGVDPPSLSKAAQELVGRLGEDSAVVLAAPQACGVKVSLVAACGPAAILRGAKAGQVIGQVAKVCGGGGGGKPYLAQAGGRDPSKLPEALDLAREVLEEQLA